MNSRTSECYILDADIETLLIMLLRIRYNISIFKGKSLKKKAIRNIH